jgi:hypothetical protein
VVIANNATITRSIAREEYLLHDRECSAGPEVHLSPTPMTLSQPSVISAERDIHHDVLDKLAWGNLYIYYEEGRLTHPSAPAQMYPITFEDIHSGYVKGTQRLVTMHSGVYGWCGQQDLHFACLYDSRGMPIAQDFLTMIDSTGARTRVELTKDQCAVVKRLPLRIQSTSPVNVHVSRYDAVAVELTASGTGPATLMVRGGDFAVTSGISYVCRVRAAEQQATADRDGLLSLPLALADHVNIRITPATKP